MQHLRRSGILLFLLCVLVTAQQLSLKTWTALSATGTTAAFAVPGNDKHTIAAIITGSPATCTIKLEGSVDGSNYFDISGSQTCTSNLMFHVVDRSEQFVRANLAALSGGTVPTVTVTYLGINSGGRQ